jgi:hypothetical protein
MRKYYRFLILLLLFIPFLVEAQTVIPKGRLRDNSGYIYFWFDSRDSGLRVRITGIDTTLTVTAVQDSTKDRLIQNAIVNARQYGTWTFSITPDSANGRYYVFIKNDSLKVTSYGTILSRVINDSLRVALYGDAIIKKIVDSIKATIYGQVLTRIINDSLRVTGYGKFRLDTTNASTVTIRDIADSIRAAIYGQVLSRIINDSLRVTGYGKFNLNPDTSTTFFKVKITPPGISNSDTTKSSAMFRWSKDTVGTTTRTIRNDSLKVTGYGKWKPDTTGASTVTVRKQDTVAASTVTIRTGSSDTTRASTFVRARLDTVNNSTRTIRNDSIKVTGYGKWKPDTTGASTVTIRSMPAVTTSQDTTKGAFIRQWTQDTTKVKVFSDTSKSAIMVRSNKDTVGTSTVTIRSMPSITSTQDTTKGSFVRQWTQDTLKVKGTMTTSTDTTQAMRTWSRKYRDGLKDTVQVDSATFKTNETRRIGIVNLDTTQLDISSLPIVRTDSSYLRRQVHIGKLDTTGSLTNRVWNNPADSLTIRGRTDIQRQDTTKSTFMVRSNKDTVSTSTVSIRVGHSDTARSAIAVKIMNKVLLDSTGINKVWNNATDSLTMRGEVNIDKQDTTKSTFYVRARLDTAQMTNRVWNNPADSLTIRGRVDIQRQDTTKSVIGVKIMNNIVNDTAVSNQNNLVRESLGYPGYQDSIAERQVLGTIEMDSLSTDAEKEKIWTPSTADSTKQLVISFISITTGDSTMGYEIQSLLTSGTTFVTLFKAVRLTGNAQVVMNFVGSPIVFPGRTTLYIRKIVPNGALYHKYIDGIDSLTGIYGSGLHVTVKYRYR